MMRLILVAVFLAGSMVSVCMADPAGDRYLLSEQWGGTWSDAEKSPDTGDDLMCWAFAASNVLDWTGWGHVEGMSNADQIVDYYKYRWFNMVGTSSDAWRWWFDDDQAWTSYVTYRPGGGFYKQLDIADYYSSSGASGSSAAMTAIDDYLHDGSGMVGTLYNTEGYSSHVVTVWGMNTANDGQDYLGLWITDSDNSEADAAPPDLLQYFEVQLSRGRWYLQDYYGLDSYYVASVHALEPIWLAMTPGDANCDGVVDLEDFITLKTNFNTSGGWGEGDFNRDGIVDLDDFNLLKDHFTGQASQVPEPSTVALLFIGGTALVRYRRRCGISP